MNWLSWKLASTAINYIVIDFVHNLLANQVCLTFQVSTKEQGICCRRDQFFSVVSVNMSYT